MHVFASGRSTEAHGLVLSVEVLVVAVVVQLWVALAECGLLACARNRSIIHGRRLPVLLPLLLLPLPLLQLAPLLLWGPVAKNRPLEHCYVYAKHSKIIIMSLTASIVIFVIVITWLGFCLRWCCFCLCCN